MSTVNDCYELFTFDVLEDLNLVLEVVTFQQYIDILNLVLQDFCQRTCIVSQIQTQSVFAGTSQYTFPDPMMRVDIAFLAGVLLEPTTVDALNRGYRSWRTTLGLPTRWHGDELPLKTVEIVPIPNDTGVYASGPNEPDPPHAQTGFNIVYNSVAYSPDQNRDLTLIGPLLPATVSATTDPLGFGSVSSPTSLIPQDFVLGYLGAGVLARVFSSDSELKDDAKAAWCNEQYSEGITLIKNIMDEAPGGR
jgi:hypothetical protein